MAKLLATRLPQAGNEVDANVFNRLIRILELNLGTFDPNATPQFNDSQISTLAFNAGDVIWNTSIGVLQVYIGNRWIQLHTPKDPQGFETTASLGSVSVKTDGNISISVTSSYEGWNIEKWYT
jgi:hypothetical protein|tara:strand:+ start:1097 stop:1465 length:369 start_codon:yes stop_codon:yes gene_type:complete